MLGAESLSINRSYKTGVKSQSLTRGTFVSSHAFIQMS